MASGIDMQNLITLQQRIDESQKIAIFGHRNIDGDCVWSCLALWTYLQSLWKHVDYYCPTPPSPIFDFLPEVKKFSQVYLASSSSAPNALGKEVYDTIFFMDTGDTANQLGHFRKENPRYFEDHPRKIVIDHHISNKGYGNLNLIDTSASSVCEYLAEIFLHIAPTAISPQIATYLFMGISTDTGNFMYEQDSPRTFDITTKILALGAKKPLIMDNLYRKNSSQKLMFLGTLLERMTLHKHVFSSRFTKQELASLNVEEEVADLFIGLFTTIEHHGIFALFKIDNTDGYIRCSLRTKNHHLDVRTIAEQCWGWGHKFASGCKFNGSDTHALPAAITTLNELTDIQLANTH